MDVNVAIISSETDGSRNARPSPISSPMTHVSPPVANALSRDGKVRVRGEIASTYLPYFSFLFSISSVFQLSVISQYFPVLYVYEFAAARLISYHTRIMRKTESIMQKARRLSANALRACCGYSPIGV